LHDPQVARRVAQDVRHEVHGLEEQVKWMFKIQRAAKALDEGTARCWRSVRVPAFCTDGGDHPVDDAQTSPITAGRVAAVRAQIGEAEVVTRMMTIFGRWGIGGHRHEPARRALRP